ncbi:hypothetical protein ACJX0J_025672, partial [Zea mays]
MIFDVIIFGFSLLAVNFKKNRAYRYPTSRTPAISVRDSMISSGTTSVNLKKSLGTCTPAISVRDLMIFARDRLILITVYLTCGMKSLFVLLELEVASPGANQSA